MKPERTRWWTSGARILGTGFLAGFVVGALFPPAGAVIWMTSWVGAAVALYVNRPPRNIPEIDYARCRAFGHDWHMQCSCCGVVRRDPITAAQYDAALEAARDEVSKL